MSLPPLPTSASNRPLTQPMSTSHSGLPPPAAMTMPQLAQGPLPTSQPLLSQPIGQLPAPPPQQWQGAEESMRSWLHAKAEEYKQKQEVEKTRQELLRLEQRRIEQDMLWTALTGGIPPYMVPRIFAGMGDGNLPNACLELPQHSIVQKHHLAQQQLQQHQQLLSVQAQSSLNRQSQRYDSQQHPIPVPPPLTPRAVQISGSQSSYLTSPASPSGQCHHPQDSPVRSSPTSHLPGPNTGELHIHPPPPGHSGMQILPSQPSHPLHRLQTAQQPQQESCYHHHHQSHSTTGNLPPHHKPKPGLSLFRSHLILEEARSSRISASSSPPNSQYTSPLFSQSRSPVSNTQPSRSRSLSRQ